MDDIKAKQQIIDKIKDSTNILVTVSNDPSVDALSAMLGLTVVLDKLDKHGTAVFSGEVPPAIKFLKPEKTVESTVDSLRDFIIALDKEKADHLRYKVEGDMVKIFITPYRTTISSDDLEFSQGDYNVELVLALGVDEQDHLDAALEAHGRILHDATVATITAGDVESDLGSIDWHDASASSLSEMIAGIIDGIKGKEKTLLDEQSATALLTGVVAETDRFSNEKTSAKAMTVAAALMAAGADQQLIATKLQENHEIDANAPTTLDPKHDDDEHDSGAPEVTDDDVVAETEAKARDTVLLNIAHDDDATLADIEKETHAVHKVVPEEHVPEEGPTEQIHEAYVPEPESAPVLTPEPAPQPAPLPESAPVFTPAPAEPLPAPAPEPVVPEPQPASAPFLAPAPSATELPDQEPSLGGTLNATTEEAAEDARALDADQNKTILSHATTIDTPAATPNEPMIEHEKVIQPLGDLGVPAPEPAFAPVAEPAPSLNPVYGVDVSGPATPSSLGLPMPPSLDSQVPPTGSPAISSAYALEDEPERLGDIFPAGAPQPPQTPPPTIAPPVAPNDPSQFQIPGAPQQ